MKKHNAFILVVAVESKYLHPNQRTMVPISCNAVECFGKSFGLGRTTVLPRNRESTLYAHPGAWWQ
jgi:hypothetical protein